jgi:SGNH hydrolase-like domain, acetyltransferase AlgX
VQMDRRAYFVVVGAFLAVIMSSGFIQTVSDLRDGERPQVLDVFRRTPTARNLHVYEKDLEKASLVVRRSRPWMQYFQWKVLADAGDNVVMGRDGWLFFRQSVQYLTVRQDKGPESDPADPMPAIRSFRDQLQARGIRLLIVPVPNKDSVYPEMLSRRAEGAGVVVCERTRRLLDALEKDGIEHVDLFDVFRGLRQEGQPDQERLYLAQDTHWSPEGARLAAVAVAQRALDGGAIIRGDRVYVERPVSVRRHGDLVRMLQVPQIERSIEPETIACGQVVHAGTGSPYRDAPESDVLVLGDSFLRIYQHDEPGSAGFIAHLARELGRPLTAIVNDGGASTVVRQELARRPTALINKKLVIWEFAEREIRYGMEGWEIVPLTRSRTSAK